MWFESEQRETAKVRKQLGEAAATARSKCGLGLQVGIWRSWHYAQAGTCTQLCGVFGRGARPGLARSRESDKMRPHEAVHRGSDWHVLFGIRRHGRHRD